MGQDLLLTLSILLSVPGRVKFRECCTGSASEAEEEVDALALVVAEKHFETAAARSFMELVLRFYGLRNYGLGEPPSTWLSNRSAASVHIKQLKF